MANLPTLSDDGFSYALRIDTESTDFSTLEIQVNQISPDNLTVTRENSGWVISGLVLNVEKLNIVQVSSPRQVQVVTYVFENSKKLRVAVTAWQNDSMASELMYGPLESWSVGLVTDMSNLFSGTFNHSLEQWDVSRVQNMTYMFNGCHHFNQPLDRWNTGQVTDLTGMFLQCYAFNQPLENWDVSQVTTMVDTFNRAGAFNQPLARWKVAQVTNMSGMFCGQGCYCQDLSSWSTPLLDTRPVSFAGDATNGVQAGWPLDQQPSFTSLVTAAEKEVANHGANGKGTLENYQELFQAATKIVNESKNVDLDGLVNVGQAAEDLSLLFAGLTLQLKNLLTIPKTHFPKFLADVLALKGRGAGVNS